MKRIILAFTMFLMLIMSACGTKQVVNNETTIEDNSTESTYDLNAAIKNAKCVTEYPNTATVDDFDTVKFGKYEQDGDDINGKEDIEWIVLEKFGGKAKLISKYILDNVTYDENSYEWETSNLRDWLNNVFYSKAFTDTKNLINYCTIPRKKLSDCIYDKVFCLNNDDIDKYFYDDNLEKIDTKATYYAKKQENNGERIEINTDYSIGYSPYYTMIPSTGYGNDVLCIFPGDGLCVGEGIANYKIGVRPVICVKYEENVFDDKTLNTNKLIIKNSEVNKRTLKDELNKIDTIEVVLSYKDKEKIDDIPSLRIGKYKVNDDKYADIEWIVLEKDMINKQALLLSKYVIDNKSYNDFLEEKMTWEQSSLREFLNDEFFNNVFNTDEKGIILSKENKNYNHNGCYGVRYNGSTQYGNATLDKVFLLSSDEIHKYFDTVIMDYDEIVATKATNYARSVLNNGIKLYINNENGFCSYWLRDIGTNNSFASTVNSIGGVYYAGDVINNHTIGVRPAMWVKYK